MPYSNLLKGRCSELNRAYFITTVVHNREPVFNDLYCARELVACMRNIHQSGVASSLSWVIMPDHFHWLLQLNKKTLSQVINQLKGVSSYNINLRLSRQGRFWQKSYYDRAIRDSENIKDVSRYIVANPLRTGLVQEIGHYSHWDAVWM